MKFKNREEVAYLLLKKLEMYKGKNPLILGIPRGAIPMAAILAESLEGELGAVLVHKIPAPGNEELAIGSVGLSGQIQWLPYRALFGVPESYIRSALKKQLDLLRSRYEKYGLGEVHYENRIVIIVDDGIATGATTLGAIAEVRLHNPQKIIVAAGVASTESARKIRKLADELILLLEPEEFYAVGQFFEDFSQVSDEEVIELLKAKKPNTL